MAIDFTAPKVTKGRITNVRTGLSQQFCLNPNTIKKTNGSHMAKDPIPGFSDPLVRFAAGKERTFKFTLDIDGEIMMRVFGTQLVNTNKPQRDVTNSYNVAGLIEFYESLTYPVDPNIAGSDGGLDQVVFSMGDHIAGVLCYVEDADATLTEFSPTLEITKAKIDITLIRVVNTNMFSNQVWASPFGQ